MFNYKIVFRKTIHYETRLLRDKMIGFSEVCVLEPSDPLASSVGLWTHLGTFLSLFWDRQDKIICSSLENSLDHFLLCRFPHFDSLRNTVI